MITVTRSLLRRVRSVLRRTGIGRRSSGLPNPVEIQTGADGLRIRGISFDAAVEYREPGTLGEEEFVLPLEFLEDCQGRTDEPVELEPSGTDQIAVRFADGGVPQLVIYPVEPKLDFQNFPAVPQSVQANEPQILPALREALGATDPSSTRFALACIELSGSQGRVTATDGKRVYRHGGFAFPWTEDVLVSGAGVVRSGEFSMDQPVSVGRTDDWVMLHLGCWKVWLRINKDGRFPQVDAVFPDAADLVTRVHLAPEDVEFLKRGIERLPVTEEDPYRPITMDLSDKVVVRAKNSDAPHPTELILSRSQVVGEPLVLVTNRDLLRHALALGFRELGIVAPDKPILCQEGPRQYLWCNLDPQEAIAPDNEAVCVESSAASGPQSRQPTSRRRSSPKSRRTIPLSGNNDSNAKDTKARPTAKSANADQPSPVSLFEQAEALRGTLRQALAQTSQLIAWLRRQRKQNRLMKSTLDSLKQLERVAG